MKHPSKFIILGLLIAISLLIPACAAPWEPRVITAIPPATTRPGEIAPATFTPTATMTPEPTGTFTPLPTPTSTRKPLTLNPDANITPRDVLRDAPVILTATPEETITPTRDGSLPLLHPVIKHPLLCPGAKPSRIKEGMTVSFISRNGAELYLHPEPGFKTDAPWTAPVGAQLPVLKGPDCVDQAYWWLVEFKGQSGWVPETMIDGEYYLEPLP